MTIAEYLRALEETQRYFNKSTSIFDEADSAFAPAAGMFTVAQQVAETATTLGWFIDGAFGDNGWDMDFGGHQAKVLAVSSLAAARQQLDAAFDRARTTIAAQSPERMEEVFPADDPIMQGARRSSILNAIADHTAHHRGALTVYARLLGKASPMPYM